MALNLNLPNSRQGGGGLGFDVSLGFGDEFFQRKAPLGCGFMPRRDGRAPGGPMEMDSRLSNKEHEFARISLLVISCIHNTQYSA
jgi:hypothetical protein